MTDTVTHRTGRSDALGELTEVIKAFKVDVETYEGLQRLAREAGHRTTREFIRETLQVMVHGADRLKRLHADRVDFVAGKLREGTEGVKP